MDGPMSKKEWFIASLWCTQQTSDIHVCHRHDWSILIYCMICRESAAFALPLYIPWNSLKVFGVAILPSYLFTIASFSLVPLPIFWNLLPKHLMFIVVCSHNYISLHVSHTFCILTLHCFQFGDNSDPLFSTVLVASFSDCALPTVCLKYWFTGHIHWPHLMPHTI